MAKPRGKGPTLELAFKPTAGSAVARAAMGEAREMAIFGARGDGKTITALGVMIAHAQQHQAAGYPLPTKWLGVADTFASHEAKTHDSVRDPLWQGLWRIRDDGHIAECHVDGRLLVQLRLTGVEDQAGMDRLRTQCHGLWFEEPAPASVMVQSSGLTETAWELAITSQRMLSHAHPAVMTLNYPDEYHWTAQRFLERPCPDGCARPVRRWTVRMPDGRGGEIDSIGEEGGCRHRYFYRIPPGELASAEQRAEWARALANRPDMVRRLLEGRFGSLMLGKQVARGFNRDVHVKACPMPDPAYPLFLGVDGGQSHHWATVIGQRVAGRVRVYGSLYTADSAAREHFEQEVVPWLGENAPWALKRPDSVRVYYDPTCETKDFATRESVPLYVMKDLLPGRYVPAPVDWTARLGPTLDLVNMMTGGQSVLEIDPLWNKHLIRALDGGWYLATRPDGEARRDVPFKPNHPHEDLGDAFCYFVYGVNPRAAERKAGPRSRAQMAFDVHSFDTARPKARMDFRVGEL